jgi:hypothetical protein
VSARPGAKKVDRFACGGSYIGQRFHFFVQEMQMACNRYSPYRVVIVVFVIAQSSVK